MKAGEGALYFLMKDDRVVRSRLSLARARKLERKCSEINCRLHAHRMSRPVFWLQLNVTDDRAMAVPDRTYRALLAKPDITERKDRFVEFCRQGRFADWRRAWASFAANVL